MKMKKTIFLFGALALMLGTSCNEKKTESTETTETTTVTDTVHVDGAMNDVPPPPPPPAAERQDGTSISVNSDGVSVDSKDGTKGTKVEVKNDGGTVEIKK